MIAYKEWGLNSRFLCEKWGFDGLPTIYNDFRIHLTVLL